MFAMFDITGQGKITMAQVSEDGNMHLQEKIPKAISSSPESDTCIVPQANAALRSALGADTELGLDEEGAYLTRDQFTEAMQSALQGPKSHKGL